MRGQNSRWLCNLLQQSLPTWGSSVDGSEFLAFLFSVGTRTFRISIFKLPEYFSYFIIFDFVLGLKSLNGLIDSLSEICMPLSFIDDDVDNCKYNEDKRATETNNETNHAYLCQPFLFNFKAGIGPRCEEESVIWIICLTRATICMTCFSRNVWWFTWHLNSCCIIWCVCV